MGDLIGNKQINALHAQQSKESENTRNMNHDSMDLESMDDVDDDYQRLDTPPPRGPSAFQQFRTVITNESEYEQDIVKPHDNYNVNALIQTQSTTEYLDSEQHIATAVDNPKPINLNNSMVSLLMDGYESGKDNEK